MEQPDSLILELKNGSEKAFSQIYDMYSRAIYGVLYNIIRDENDAEELLQDVFVKIWNNIATYAPEKGRFYTWMLNIARNAAIDKTRSKSFKNSQRNLSTENFVDIIATSDSLNRLTNTIGIRKFVEALKPVCIKIIELLYFKGYTQADAAEALEMPLGTIKTRNRNCMNELRNMLDE